MARESMRFTPFHLAAAAFLVAGLAVAVYHGLEQFELVPALGWTSWSHVHFVTVGAFTQLLFGTLPQVTAVRLDRPLPPRWYDWAGVVGLDGGFLLLWYGRGWGQTWAFDLGLVVVWLLVAGLLVLLGRMALESDRAWNPTTVLHLVSVFVFLWGITYAYGLYAHVWNVPGGWLGLREAHVHANAWGFLGLSAVGTLLVLFGRVVGVDRDSRLPRYATVLLVAGIFPLITGPWLGMGRTVTATGLVLFGAGFALYLAELVWTYRAATDPPGVATWLLGAQFWLLAPAAFAPFVLFGVEWVPPAYVEDAALHFFFVGWALPVALSGLLLYFRNLPCRRPGALGLADRVDPTDLLPDDAIPEGVSWTAVAAWNLAVLAVGVGFLSQDHAWSATLFAPGYAVLASLWLAAVGRAVSRRRSLRRDASAAGEGS